MLVRNTNAMWRRMLYRVLVLDSGSRLYSLCSSHYPEPYGVLTASSLPDWPRQENPEKWMGDQPFHPGFRFRDNQRESMAGIKFPPDLLNAGDYKRQAEFSRDRHPSKEVRPMWDSFSNYRAVCYHCKDVKYPVLRNVSYYHGILSASHHVAVACKVWRNRAYSVRSYRYRIV